MNLKNKIKMICKCPKSWFCVLRYSKPKIMNDEKTIDYILENKCSIGRYGDGELYLMNGIGIKFQKSSKELKDRLVKIGKTSSSNKFLICIPDVFDKKRLKQKFKHSSYSFWTKHLSITRGLWYGIFNYGFYGDSLMTRFYMDRSDKSRTEEYVRHLKKLWENRNIVIVEGKRSRLGMGNDLFDNAYSVRRILCPEKDAFDKYDSILNAVVENTGENDLIICALGPTATVLCYDLSINNRQALDLGHIDIEYEWFLSKAKEKITIKGKSSAEAQGVFIENETNDIENVIAKID